MGPAVHKLLVGRRHLFCERTERAVSKDCKDVLVVANAGLRLWAIKGLQFSHRHTPEFLHILSARTFHRMQTTTAAAAKRPAFVRWFTRDDSPADEGDCEPPRKGMAVEKIMFYALVNNRLLSSYDPVPGLSHEVSIIQNTRAQKKSHNFFRGRFLYIINFYLKKKKIATAAKQARAGRALWRRLCGGGW